MLSGLLMENKTESIDLLGIKSGEMDQMSVVPAVGAGEVETKVTDPSQAELTPGGRVADKWWHQAVIAADKWIR